MFKYFMKAITVSLRITVRKTARKNVRIDLWSKCGANRGLL